jgi:TonB family protein
MYRRYLSLALGLAIVAAPSLIASAQPSPTAAPCTSPHVNARVVNVVQPAYPMSVRIRGVAGFVQVKVTLNEAGAVVAASVYKSSGEQELDEAALLAARSSTYSPEVVDCQAVRGIYLFRAEFKSTLAEPCAIGVAALVPTADKNVWAVVLSRSSRGSLVVRVTLYSRTASYAADLRSVNFDKGVPFDDPLSDALRPFRADAAFVRVDASEAIDAATAEPIEPTHYPCVLSYGLSEPSRPVRSDLRQQIAAAREAIATRLPADSAIVTAARVAALTEPSCVIPYSNATVTKAVSPDYPRAAMETGQTGGVIVRVGISETGAVTDAKVMVTSGSPILDKAALDAARRSSYSAPVFLCKPVAGFYTFRTDFASR